MTDAAPTRETSAFRLAVQIPRSDSDRLLTGFAAGVGDRLGIGPSYARAGLTTLAAAGGVGIVVYVVGVLASFSAPPPAERAPLSKKQAVGLILIFLGILYALGTAGLWFPGATGPIGLLSFGAAAIWSRSDRNDVPLIEAIASNEQSRFRAIGGAALMGIGLLILVSSLTAVEIGPVLLAVIVTASGFALALGPSVWRISRNLTAERRDRIRAEEREDMAAHLHDSVLQSLALIQRTDDPKKMATLARAQERELREWLYAERVGSEPRALSLALQDAASKVEAAYNVPIDVIVVGEVDVSDNVRAMTRAAAEAMTNAATHSGADKISVYAESREGTTDIWITDLGRGFDMDDISEGRRGVSDSIMGRMERHGGVAEIETSDEGTEVHLSLTERTT
jgi:signal transduction histidine kinase